MNEKNITIKELETILGKATDKAAKTIKAAEMQRVEIARAKVNEMYETIKNAQDNIINAFKASRQAEMQIAVDEFFESIKTEATEQEDKDLEQRIAELVRSLDEKKD